MVVHYLINSSGVELVSIDSTLALNAAYLAARLYIKGADSMYVALAQVRNIPLVSWDNEQLNRAAVVSHKFTPATFPF
jgi:predicted nucleic acid-binding protein